MKQKMAASKVLISPRISLMNQRNISRSVSGLGLEALDREVLVSGSFTNCTIQLTFVCK